MEIGSGRPEAGARLTRRQFSRKVAGSAAGLLLCSTAEGQESPATKETPSEADPRIASLEKERSAPLTPDQRKRLPGELKDLDEGAAVLRKFPLPDGGGEPRVVFVPIEPDRLARIRAAREEGSNG